MPDFAGELTRLLEGEGRADLAQQVTDLRIVGRCRCGDDFCATIYTAPRPRGEWTNHESIMLEAAETGILILDVAAGRIVEIEALYRDDLRGVLTKLFP
jgi:hypothetical protein